MLLRIEIGEQLIRYTPPGRPNRTDFATFAREVSSLCWLVQAIFPNGDWREWHGGVHGWNHVSTCTAWEILF